MIAMLTLLAIGQLEFEPATIDDLYIYTDSINARGAINGAKQRDVDGDGFVDIVFDEGAVALQRDGRFPNEARVRLPEVEDAILQEPWHGRVYSFTSSEFTVHTFEDEVWSQGENGTIQWPGARSIEGTTHRIAMMDVNGDDVPEILWQNARAIAVLALQTGSYTVQTRWPLPAGASRTGFRQAHVWPPEARQVQFPSVWTMLQFAIKPGEIAWSYWRHNPDTNYAKCCTLRQAFDLNSFELETTPAAEWESELIPLMDVEAGSTSGFVAPDQLHLNGDGQWDFLITGTSIQLDSANFGPRHTVRVSTNGGKDFDVLQARFPRNSLVVTDIDGDGRKDIALHNTSLLDKGPREALLAAALKNDLDHRVDIHLQDDQGRFWREPSFSAACTIRMDRPLIQQSDMALEYQYGFLVSVAGDYDGDGKKDLAYTTDSKTIAIRRGTGSGFEEEPAATITFDAAPGIVPLDLNGDGLDDICLNENLLETGGAPVGTVFFSRIRE